MEPIFDFQAAVVGGDSRQIAVAGALTHLFKNVKIFGHPQEKVSGFLEYVASLNEAVANTKIIVLPIGGMNREGLVRSYQGEAFIDFGKLLPELNSGTLLVTGSLSNNWLQLAESLNLKVIQYADDDEIAILNSIPTAEGTLQLVMENTPITIHGSRVVIIGFGRVGVTLARNFQALGAEVIVTARRRSALARATEMGFISILTEFLPEKVGTVDVIINTVPAMIIDSQLITKLQPDTLIIDLASPPGGTDFEAAKALNIKAILAPGLPGLVAPKTAGAILADILPKLIVDFINKGGAA